MTHRDFFDALRDLSPLRGISPAGPSIFEGICDFQNYALQAGMMNAFTEQYHWHVELGRFGHLRSHDELHERSGRRVLYFGLREHAGDDPFLLVYLFRDKHEEFGAAREARFAALHAELAQGAVLA